MASTRRFLTCFSRRILASISLTLLFTTAILVSLAEAYIKNAVSAEKAGQIIANTITSKQPRTRYTIGRDAAMVRFMNWILPDRILDKLVARSNKAHYPK